MNKMTVKSKLHKHTACLISIILLGTTVALADIPGTIIQTDGGRVSGLIRWQGASKVYGVTRKRPQGGNIETKIPLSKVAKLEVKKPAKLESAAKMVRTRQYDRAIPVLDKIMKTYTMIQWDMPAARWLAEAYLKTKRPKNAAGICEKILNSKFAAQAPSELYRIYCHALLETRQYAKLRKIIRAMIEKGTREDAAVAQIMRGDMDMKKGNFKDALVDGYLRTVVLFNHVKHVQPEALYKAVKCFEELGQTSHAEKMRKILLAKYPGDPYTDNI